PRRSSKKRKADLEDESDAFTMMGLIAEVGTSSSVATVDPKGLQGAAISLSQAHGSLIFIEKFSKYSFITGGKDKETGDLGDSNSEASS
ncbi:hypothetical protein HAX54_050886, partial [Datura stramonium]|nr:hypothetical protein [Datura stramonium]